MQIDFEHITPNQGYKYVPVIVDIFSKWDQAFPTRKGDVSVKMSDEKDYS